MGSRPPLLRDKLMCTLLAIGMPGPMEWIIIGALGLLLFGKHCPKSVRAWARESSNLRRA